ncbi:MAG: pro-sigmaK processing inhibitor BofA family protein [Clostridia bacterium]|nr:pro-sigmaK processing inhibitor BofA family protein [Clostridia bacterium]
MEFVMNHALLIVGGIFLLWVLIKLFTKPIRLIAKLACNTAIGYIALLLLNWVGKAVDISLGLSWPNAMIIGVFGYPGLILLLLLKYFF